jgi:hypothetical protein
MARTTVFRLVVALLAVVWTVSSAAWADPPADSGLEPAPSAEGLSPTSPAPPLPTEALRGEMAAASMAPAEATAPEAGGGEFFTLDELRGEMRRLAWTKGDYTITPYGILWGSMAYESQRTSPGDYPLYVPPDRADFNNQTHVDARSTRLGLDVVGPQIELFNDASSGGKVEFDFQRQLDTENKPGVLLRHAYIETKNEDFRLLFGQTWDVISPLYPGLIMYSVGWGGGNIGYRRAQFRGERYLEISETLLFTAQGSLNTDIIADAPAGVMGQQAGWPVLEGRLAMTIGERGPGRTPMEFGVSSHVGETIYDITAINRITRPTWSFNVDAKVPIAQRFGVQAEFFTGENLAAFLGGVLQGIDFGSVAHPGSLDPIRSTGGWVDVYFDWTPRLHSHVGYSIDDPFDQDVTVGRTYNAFYFANLCFDLTPKCLVGLEFTSWRTMWVNNAAGDMGNSQRLEFAVKYGF